VKPGLKCTVMPYYSLIVWCRYTNCTNWLAYQLNRCEHRPGKTSYGCVALMIAVVRNTILMLGKDEGVDALVGSNFWGSHNHYWTLYNIPVTSINRPYYILLLVCKCCLQCTSLYSSTPVHVTPFTVLLPFVQFTCTRRSTFTAENFCPSYRQ
jgi:hypothetical protein